MNEEFKQADCRESTAIVLPSLDPDIKFSGVVDGLLQEGFQHVVIVNDGSAAERRHFFEEAAQKPGCTVLTHEVNRGKGRALKTAFGYVREQMPELRGVITIDGDGQHLVVVQGNPERSVQGAQCGKGDEPVILDTVLNTFPLKASVNLSLSEAVHLTEVRLHLLAVAQQL